jgi:hypothetical protein
MIGVGVEEDTDLAIEWFSKASDCGSIVGAFNAACRLKDRGDHDEAFKMMKSAADGLLFFFFFFFFLFSALYIFTFIVDGTRFAVHHYHAIMWP